MRLAKSKMKYFLSVWNYVDVIPILLVVAVLALDILYRDTTTILQY